MKVTQIYVSIPSSFCPISPPPLLPSQQEGPPRGFFLLKGSFKP